MREYELTVVYNLTVAEAGGPAAAADAVTQLIAARGGNLLRVDHWGRRRLAYPINGAIDGDYVVSRVELEPTAITALEGALRIDERVYRHLVVRADELPAPPQPREPRRPRPVEGSAEVVAPAAVAPVAEAPAAAPEAAAAPVAEAPASEPAAGDAPAASE
ncbi:MAG: 30S ribosomal protein S6 [Dehalococcoidia bacterium]